MRWINTMQEALPYMAEIAGVGHTNNAILIAEQDDDAVVAIGIFDQFNGRSIHAHIWIAHGRRPSRVWWWAMHDYPYWQLGITNVVATVSSSNTAVIKVVRHLGGRLRGRIRDYHEDGSDLLIFSGTEDDSPFWRKFQNGRASPPNYRRNLQKASA